MPSTSFGYRAERDTGAASGGDAGAGGGVGDRAGPWALLADIGALGARRERERMKTSRGMAGRKTCTGQTRRSPTKEANGGTEHRSRHHREAAGGTGNWKRRTGTTWRNWCSRARRNWPRQDAAEAANRRRRCSLANMSHELRTPMNGIMGMTALALRPGDGRQADRAVEQPGAAAPAGNHQRRAGHLAHRPKA